MSKHFPPGNSNPFTKRPGVTPLIKCSVGDAYGVVDLQDTSQMFSVTYIEILQRFFGCGPAVAVVKHNRYELGLIEVQPHC